MPSRARAWGGGLWLVCALAASGARADESPHRPPPPAPTDTGPRQPPPTPPPEYLPPAPPSPATPAAPLPPPAAAVPVLSMRDGRQQGGIGTGVFALTPAPGKPGYRGDVALVLHGRRVNMLSDVIGLELVQQVTIHDWETIGNVYQWYFEDTDGEPDKSNVGTKLLVLWPGLLIAPFMGANLSTGFGLVGYLNDKAPSVFVDVGGEFALMLRVSDEDFRADVGLGLYAGFGFELSATSGIGVRASYIPPIYRTSCCDSEARALTVAVTLDFARR